MVIARAGTATTAVRADRARSAAARRHRAVSAADRERIGRREIVLADRVPVVHDPVGIAGVATVRRVGVRRTGGMNPSRRGRLRRRS